MAVLAYFRTHLWQIQWLIGLRNCFRDGLLEFVLGVLEEEVVSQGLILIIF